MTTRTDRDRAFGSRRRRAGVVFVVPLLLAWDDPELGARVNHELTPQQSIAGWGLQPSGQRVVYGVREGGAVWEAHRLFSASSDGSQDVLALTPPFPADRTIYTWAISADGQHVVFAADLEANDRFELYSVTTDGAQVPVKLSAPILPDNDVLSIALTPDGSRVLYLTAVPSSGRNTLNSAPVDGSQPAVVIHVPEPGVYGFLAFRATSDSRRVLYWSRPDRILSAPVDGSTPPIQISPSADALEPDVDYLLSPDGEWIVFYSATAGGSDVFSARADGSAPPRALFFPNESGNATELDASTPTAFQISGDSSRVVGLTSEFQELRVASIDGTARPVVLTDPPDFDRAYFRIARDGNVVFRASPWGAPQQRSLFAIPMDGSSRARMLTGLRGDAGSVKHEVAPQGDVVFDGRRDGRYWLFTVPIDGSKPAQALHPLVAGGNVYDANSTNGRSFLLSPDGAWLLYLADQEQDGVRELFAVAPDGYPSVRKVNGALPAGVSVLSYTFGPDSRRLFYGTWTSSGLARGIFTSVIADEALDRLKPASGTVPSPAPADESGTLLVEDPGREQRDRALRSAADTGRAPDGRSDVCGRVRSPREDAE